MRGILITTIFLSITQIACGATAEAPDGADIIREMIATYRGMTSFEEIAKETLEGSGDEQHFSRERWHLFRYRAPNCFYYDTVARERKKAVCVSDGQTVITHFPSDKFAFKANAPTSISECGNILRQMEMQTQLDPFAFLVGRNPLVEGAKAQLVRTFHLDGIAVHEVALTIQVGDQATLWIGRDDKLLRKIMRKRSFARGKRVFSFKNSEIHKRMKNGIKLADDAFAYALPDDINIRETKFPTDKSNSPFGLHDLNGNNRKLSDKEFQNKIIVLNFFASW